MDLDANVNAFFQDFSIMKLDDNFYMIQCLNELCLELKLDFSTFENRIILDTLQKCGSNTGTTLIKKVQNFARENNFHKIVLTDLSSLLFYFDRKIVNFDLKILFLLSRGITWYNSLGFHVENVEKQREMDENHARIVNENVSVFLKICVETCREKNIHENSR